MLAADRLPRLFPLLMTAAGTVAPAKVLVLGAGVAGLQAIATARRLGAVVSGFDVRPAVREQVESLGASFLDLGVRGAETERRLRGRADGRGAGTRSRPRSTSGSRSMDVVVTTALVPGRPAPRLIPATRGRADAARLRDRRPRRRGGRQLRADRARRGGRAATASRSSAPPTSPRGCPTTRASSTRVTSARSCSIWHPRASSRSTSTTRSQAAPASRASEVTA